MPDHQLLDRAVRGRVWIPLLGVLLVGIVAMQVEVLKLNAGIGRALEQGTALQSRNQLLRASVASLSDDQRIESLAAQMGMVMPSPASVRFLSAGAATDQRALASIHQPDATGFAALLATDDPATVSTTTQGTTVSTPGLATATATPAAATTPAVAPAASTTASAGVTNSAGAASIGATSGATSGATGQSTGG